MNPKRWPVIRHIRWWWGNYQVSRWCEAWGALCMSESDQKYLDAIWRGER